MPIGRGLRRSLAAGVVSLLLVGAACTGGEESAETTDPDTLTRAQKDSLLSTMPVPGAGAVGKALDAAEKARARAEQHDTIG